MGDEPKRLKTLDYVADLQAQIDQLKAAVLALQEPKKTKPAKS